VLILGELDKVQISEESYQSIKKLLSSSTNSVKYQGKNDEDEDALYTDYVIGSCAIATLEVTHDNSLLTFKPETVL
jgi:hypothetical protein